MIERERKKKIEKRQAEEEKAMADIRRKMERIKEQRIQKHRQKYDNHYQGERSMHGQGGHREKERDKPRSPREQGLVLFGNYLSANGLTTNDKGRPFFLYRCSLLIGIFMFFLLVLTHMLLWFQFEL